VGAEGDEVGVVAHHRRPEDLIRSAVIRPGGDLDQVVVQDAVSGPDSDAFGAIDPSAAPAFEVTDSAFAAGSPFDGASEGFSMFFGRVRKDHD
jgi:hypothetical protein